jgi:hypothetical protein
MLMTSQRRLALARRKAGQVKVHRLILSPLTSATELEDEVAQERGLKSAS